MKIKVYCALVDEAKDEMLFDMLVALKKLREIDIQLSEKLYKNLCKRIRDHIGTNNLIAVARHISRPEVGIFIFPRKAGENDNYQNKRDEWGKYYIEVEV